MWSPFVLSKQTESQLADFTQLFFGQALRSLLSVKFIPALALVHDYEKRCFVRLGLAAGADRIR
ncbi:hypothetical protein ELG71_09945 [Rhizobium leguminosarum]|nr:hypothetical protein ELG71_09945 [Rhizobium leguminosarum]